jgi:hypothetical protein
MYPGLLLGVLFVPDERCGSLVSRAALSWSFADEDSRWRDTPPIYLDSMGYLFLPTNSL